MKTATELAQQIADQELEACCEWLSDPANTGLGIHVTTAFLYDLRAARCPKSPSLKEQAITILNDIDSKLDAAYYNILLRALEALPND